MWCGVLLHFQSHFLLLSPSHTIPHPLAALMYSEHSGHILTSGSLYLLIPLPGIIFPPYHRTVSTFVFLKKYLLQKWSSQRVLLDHQSRSLPSSSIHILLSFLHLPFSHHLTLHIFYLYSYKVYYYIFLCIIIYILILRVYFILSCILSSPLNCSSWE